MGQINCPQCGQASIGTGHTCRRCGCALYSIEGPIVYRDPVEAMRDSDAVDRYTDISAQLATAHKRIAELEAQVIKYAGFESLRGMLAAQKVLADIRRALAGEAVESDDETVAKVVRLVDIKKIWDKLGAPDEQ